MTDCKFNNEGGNIKAMYLFTGRAIRKRFEDHVKNNRYDKIKSMFKRGTIKVIKL